MAIIYVTKTGDDSTGDGSLSSPFLTIGASILAATPGDEISIGDGTYNENITINKSLTIRSTSGDKTLVTITSSVVTVSISNSTNNVVVRDITIITNSTTLGALDVNIVRDFSVNPSGLPDLSTLCENILIQGCDITFNKYAIGMNSKDGVVKQCRFTQVGTTSSYAVFLVYSIDNLSILENVHVTSTANMRQFINLASLGAGEYRRNKMTVKQNDIQIPTVSPGHFIMHELGLAHPSGDKFSMDVQGNNMITTQSATGGLVILFIGGPSPTSILQDTYSTTDLSVIANNEVINPYRGWLYVDVGLGTPSPMGDTYFNIYGNTFTGTKSQRPGSYDVDGQTNVLVSATPANTSGWNLIYNTSTKIVSVPTATSENQALDILQETFINTYPGETVSIPLTLISINTEDDPTIVFPIIHQSSDPVSDTDAGTLEVTITNPNSGYRYMFLVLDTPYRTTDALSFVLKVYDNVTNSLVLSSINAILEFNVGSGNANKNIKIFKYIHPQYTELGSLVETITPGKYTFTLNSNSLYSLQIQPETTTAATDNLWWVVGTSVVVLGAVLLLKNNFVKTPSRKTILKKK